MFAFDSGAIFIIASLQNRKFLIRVEPLVIIDNDFNGVFDDDFERLSGLSVINLTLREFVDYLINKKKKITEEKLIGKILSNL